MTTELRIHLEGDADVLKSGGRISVAAFGKALQHLLSALRRTASGIVTAASDRPGYGERGGKYAEAAKLLDLEIAASREGSLDVDFVCVARLPNVGQLDMFSLAEDSVLRLVEDIESEAKGKPRNPAARKFLQNLPTGIRAQRYDAVVDGEVRRSATLGGTEFVEESIAQHARVLRLTGRVAAFGVETGREYVSVRVLGILLRLAASPELVHRAIELRDVDVQVVILDAKKPTLIRIDDVRVQVGGTPGQRWRHIATQWDGALAELAR